MAEIPADRRTAAILFVIAAVLFLSVLLRAGPPSSPYPAPVGTSPILSAGDGLLAIDEAQNVSAQQYWEPYCAGFNETPYCTDPVGVAYDNLANTMIVTMTTAPGGGGANAFDEFNPVTLSAAPLVRLSCAPLTPFYPGVGPDFFVPCVNESTYASGPIYLVNATSDSIVGSIPVPFETWSMTYDPTNGMVYASGGTDSLAEINATGADLVQVDTVGAWECGVGAGVYGCFGDLVYDPDTNALVGSDRAGLGVINPTNGSVEATVPLPASPGTLGIAPAAGLLFAGAAFSGELWVLDSTNYAPRESISLPSCFGYVCDYNRSEQILDDPTHGDVYVNTGIALWTFNTSADEIVAGNLEVGGVPPVTAAYVASDDRIFGTYDDGVIGPGFVMQLSHTETPIVAQLLWLPAGPGTLAASVVIGGVLALASAFRPRHHGEARLG